MKAGPAGDITYLDLMRRLLEMNDDQLEQKVRIAFNQVPDPDRSRLSGVFVAAEDMVDPTGEGIEPASTYAGLPEYAAEPVVARKWDVFLLFE